ncbi:hypothetical protein KR084_004949 [Drosophila pseudotakahashii]|nr:hypothetical protein KR084_004949 [Drosophila pseudotakahashii]
MNREIKPPTAPKLLHLNVTSGEQQAPVVDPLPVGPLTPEETQVLLQKLSINNPFYRFRKQSNSLKELRRRGGLVAPSVRSRSETDLGQGQVGGHQLLPQQHSEAKVVVVLESKQQQQEVAISSRPRSSVSLKTRSVSSLMSPAKGNQQSAGDSSTVITNPFSIFHDDEILTLSVNTRLRTAGNARSTRPQPQRQARGLRRLFESSSRSSQNTPSEHHYLHGVPVRRFERQDFDNDPGDLLGRRTNTSASGKPKRSRAIFKQLSLRKLHHRGGTGAAGGGGGVEEPPSLPKLKLSYPNRTHSIQSMRASGGGGYDIQHTTAYHPRLNHSTSPVTKANYFERLQAKTRQGIQKIRDKCRNFKTTAGEGGSSSEFSGFHTLAKDESFRFISDRAHISSYESRCKQATIYKSYKSEIDLSKNLHYLDAYLEQNFDHQLSSTKQTAHSVGRVSGAQRRALAKQPDPPPAPETPRRPRHKRSQSQAANYGANYENLGTLPIASKSKVRSSALHSDSMSSSDYASVFSGPTTTATHRQEPELEPDPHPNSKDFKLRYEHPDKMCEYYFDNLTSYALALEESEDLLLAESAKSARFFYDDADEEDDDEAGDAAEGLGVEDEDEAAGGRPDYMARDIRIRVSVNECEDADWHQPASATSYNENLAESTFYQSLNQHLQRQEVGDDVVVVGLEDQNLLVGERGGGGGESYLEHFQQQQRASRNYERAANSALYPRGEFYGFGRSGGEGGEQPDVARQRRADLMEAHYARSYQSGSRGKGGGRTRGLTMEMERQHAAIPAAAGAAATAMPAATGSVINLALPGQSGDVLYATSSKQQITMPTPTAGPQFHQPKPEPAALGGAAVGTATTSGASAAATSVPGSSAGNANNRYMLENLRKYYANQQQHPPAHSVNSSSLSNSSSSNSSMSQQQQQQQLKLNPNLQPTAPKVQQQHLGNRRNSSTSNASSTADNFDTFITLRNATGNAGCTSTDYMAKQQQQQQHRRGKQQQQQQSVPLTSALNYYGHGATPTLNPALAYNGKLTATAMLSQVNLSRAAAAPAATSSSGAAATTGPLLPHQQHSRSTSKGEGFILEYEC